MIVCMFEAVERVCMSQATERVCMCASNIHTYIQTSKHVFFTKIALSEEGFKIPLPVRDFYTHAQLVTTNPICL